ncbi:MAG: queuosine precursor transporter [Planctomycetota bacterium]|jgi:uncharacterized integral membrane protein (TIGR00697 family)
MYRVIAVVVAYVAAQMLADVASLKIVLVAGMSIDAGTFVYPFTFTLRDLVHKTVGIKGARFLIFIAALVNIVMAGLFWLASQLPADLEVGPQAEFATVLAPVWRIVAASIVAEVLSELIDTEAYRLWVERVTHKYQWARVLISNAVSVPLDSAVFCALAFYGTMPDSVVWSIFVSNVLIKGAVTLLSLPGIYLVKEREEVTI